MGAKAELDIECIKKQILAGMSAETIARLNKTSRSRVEIIADEAGLTIKKSTAWAKSYKEAVPETF